MSGPDRSSRIAEVLGLGLVEGVGVRAIARKLGMSRKTVRKILGRHRAPPKPPEKRGSVLDTYEPTIDARWQKADSRQRSGNPRREARRDGDDARLAVR